MIKKESSIIEESTTKEIDQTLSGILLMIVGVAVLTLNDVFIKLVVETIPIGPAICLRSGFSIIALVLFLGLFGRIRELRVTQYRMQFFSGCIMTLSIVTFVYTLSELPISITKVIVYTSPLIVTALAPVFLAEKVGWRRITAVLIGFAGALVVIQPGYEPLQLAMVGALCTAFLMSFRDMTLRKIVKTEGPYSVIFFASCICVVVTAPWAFVSWQPINQSVALLLTLSGLFFTIAQLLITEGFKRGEASLVSPFKYFGTVFAVILGYLVWGEVPAPSLYVGAMMIVGSGVYIIAREQRPKHAQQDSQTPL